MTSGERGQGTVEWVGLVLLVAIAALGVGAAAGPGVPGADLARAVAARIVCAAKLSGTCQPTPGRLEAAYGDELAALLAERAPTIHYERGMRALPVDYRRCREDACAEGAETGAVGRSRAGEPVVAFTRVIDCRPGTPPPSQGEVDCSGEAAGGLYLQYWFYYPGSATGEGTIAPRAIRAISGAVDSVTSRVGIRAASFHPDDWESFSLRIDGAERLSRASSHHGYGRGWVPDRGSLWVAGGSHAGAIRADRSDRWTPPERLTLIPLEPIAGGEEARFEVVPPWRKRVWRDPEAEGTG